MIATRVTPVNAVTFLQNIFQRGVTLSNSIERKISPAILRPFFYFFIFSIYSEYSDRQKNILER